MPLSRIERISITDEVVKRIADSIRTGEYAVGEKLPTEMELQKRLGVGRSTIREAFRVLQAIGLIELRPGRGAFVKRAEENTYERIRSWFVAKEAELTELMEVRMAIEPLGARLAIQRGTPRQINQIREIHSAFMQAVDKEDTVRLATLDESFHDSIMRASNNDLLINIGRLIADAFVEYRTRSFAVKENIRNAVGPHERIMNAILAKDEKAVVQEVQRHLEISLEDVLKVAGKKK